MATGERRRGSEKVGKEEEFSVWRDEAEAEKEEEGGRRRSSVNQREGLWVTTCLNLTLPLLNAALLQMRGMERDNKKRQCIFERNKKGAEAEYAAAWMTLRSCCKILFHPFYRQNGIYDSYDAPGK